MKSLSKSDKPVELASPSMPERFKTIDPNSAEAKIAQELCDSLNQTVRERNKTQPTPNK